jgi:hypothetical protein
MFGEVPCGSSLASLTVRRFWKMVFIGNKRCFLLNLKPDL